MLLRPEKCSFGQQSIEFLGHLVSKDGIQPLPDRINAIKEYHRPETPKALSTFRGLWVGELLSTFHPRRSRIASSTSPAKSSKASQGKLDMDRGPDSMFRERKGSSWKNSTPILACRKCTTRIMHGGF
jgi:hypothetical protein